MDECIEGARRGLSHPFYAQMSQQGIEKTKVTKQVSGRAKTRIKSCYLGLCCFYYPTLNEGSWTRVLKVTKMRHLGGSKVFWSFDGIIMGKKQNDFHLVYSFFLNSLWFPIVHYTPSLTRVGTTSILYTYQLAPFWYVLGTQ